MSTSAISVASTSSKSKSKKSAFLSKTTEVEIEPVVISEEEQETEGTVPEGQDEDFPERVAVPGRKRKGIPMPFKTADMKGKILNLSMDLQQCAREFSIPARQRLSADGMIFMGTSPKSTFKRLNSFRLGTVVNNRQVQSNALEMPRNAMGVAYKASDVQLHGDATSRHHTVGTSQGESQKGHWRVN